MTERSYGQFCAVAKALDQIGERWTLLLVRELMLGPRRFTDLQNALAGLGTSLLSARLKRLEEIGAVKRDRLPPPAASTVYELTELGWGIAPVVKALAEWGTRLLENGPSNDETFRPEWLALMTSAMAQPDPRHTETYEIRVNSEVLHIRVAGGRAQARVGPAPAKPELVLSTDTKTFAEVGFGRLDLMQAVRQGRVRSDGDTAVLKRAARVLAKGA